MKKQTKRKILDFSISFGLFVLCLLALRFFVPYYPTIAPVGYTPVLGIQMMFLYGVFILGAGGFFVMTIMAIIQKSTENTH